MVGRNYLLISSLTHHFDIMFLVKLQQQGDNTAMVHIEHLFPGVETR